MLEIVNSHFDSGEGHIPCIHLSSSQDLAPHRVNVQKSHFSRPEKINNIIFCNLSHNADLSFKAKLLKVEMIKIIRFLKMNTDMNP